jgi:hypothetical protein
VKLSSYIHLEKKFRTCGALATRLYLWHGS